MRRFGSPTLQTLAVFTVVFALQSAIGFVSRSMMYGLFALAPPVSMRPWALVLSVYAHDSFAHLFSNAVALLFAGLLVERVTTTLRFHAYFLTVGMVAGLAQIWVGGLVGPASAVLGASGAVFGLFGYLLASNPVSDAVFGRIRLPGWVKVALVVGFALAATLATAAPRVALIAHFTGLAVGLVAGRFHVLRVETQGTSNARPVS